MAKQIIDSLVNGGKASAAPPLGPALGPLGVNIGLVVAEINKKTAAFAGMQVPVKVIVDDETKEFEITVGTPPASGLIKKEAGIEKGSSNPKSEKVADLKIQQINKIVQMKGDALLGKNKTAKVKEIIGTCLGMGVMVEGKDGKEILKDIDNGAFKDVIESGKTEISAEELKKQEEEKKHLQEEIEAKRAEFEATADTILKEMEGKPRSDIKKKMIEAGLPEVIIHERLPAEAAVKPGDKPAEGATKPVPGKK